MHLRCAGCLLDLVPARSKLAIANVVLNACIEQHRVLRDDADRATEAALCDVPDVLPVDKDAALTRLEVVEAVEQAQDGGLSRAGFTNERNGGALGYFEADAVERGCPTVVREADVV